MSENGSSEPTDLDKKIIKQVEYYFGDVNLGRDKFLQGKIKEDEGWVDMETMLLFNRLKSISDDSDVIVAALKKSTSGLMEVNEDGKKIRRSADKPLPEVTSERLTNMKKRTVYVKGFPVEKSLDDIQEYLEKYGTIEHIQLRRDMQKNFKGSVFALFGKEEEAKKFINMEEVKYEETDLVRMLKDDYFKKKGEEKKQLRETELQEKEESKKKKEDDDKESFLKRITQGAVLELKGIPEGVRVEDLKEQFGEYVNIGWVEFRMGQTEAKIRFNKENGASEALEKAKAASDGKVKVKDTEVESKILEGDEEIAYWKEMFRQAKDRKSGNRRGFQGHGGRRGHRSRPNKRRKQDEGDDGSDGEDGPSPKKEAQSSPKKDKTDEPSPKKAKTEEKSDD